jgi:hypothetical protein
MKFDTGEKIIVDPLPFGSNNFNNHFNQRPTCISACILTVTYSIFIEYLSNRSSREELFTHLMLLYSFCKTYGFGDN